MSKLIQVLKILTITAIPFMTIVSCKKGRANFVLTGTISDGSFSTNLNNCSITLKKVPAGGGPEIEIETISSSDGTYRFEFERDQSESYQLVVMKNNYFKLDETIYFSELSIKSETVKNYTTYAKSWARLHFVSTNPQAGDQLKYIKTKGLADCEECCTSDYVLFTEVPDTTVYCINNGNSEYAINYWKLGTTISGSKSAVTTPFDTVDIVVSY